MLNWILDRAFTLVHNRLPVTCLLGFNQRNPTKEAPTECHRVNRFDRETFFHAEFIVYRVG